MGIVFAPEAITEGRIPGEGAHEAAGRFILDQLFETKENWTEEELRTFEIDGGSSSVDSGLVYGPTALAETTVRSDVDVLLNFRDYRANIALPLMRRVIRTAKEQHNVPVEPHLLPFGALFNPLDHDIDPLFAQHLMGVESQDEPRWSYHWPLDGLKSSAAELRRR